jgi:hypothetical protein
MLFGVVCLVGGLVWLPLSQWLATIAYLFLAWLTEGAAVRQDALRGRAVAAVSAVAAAGVLCDRSGWMAVECSVGGE